MNELDARRLVGDLLAAFPSARIRPETPEVYSSRLRDLDLADAAAVIEEFIRCDSELPSVGAIRQAVAERREAIPTAFEAWVQITTRGVKMHPLTREVCGYFGGTWAFDTSENRETLRAQFLRAYDDYRRRWLRKVNLSMSSGPAAA
jgi:hypothetical protein